MSSEKGPKATIVLAPTGRRFWWKTADEHCNRETRDGVNTFPEHSQGAACGRTESAHVTPSVRRTELHSSVRAFRTCYGGIQSPRPTSHTSPVGLVIARDMPLLFHHILLFSGGKQLCHSGLRASKGTSYIYPRTFATPDGSRTYHGKKK